jgi:prolyl oligopeptidase
MLAIHLMRCPLLILLPLVAAAQPTPPPTAKHPVTDVVHGVPIRDDYRWLEDQNSPETRSWIDAQMKYTRGLLDSVPGRDAIRARLTELLRVDHYSVPVVRGGREVFQKRPAAATRAAIYLRLSGGSDQLLVDPAEATADPNGSVSIEDLTADGRVLAYGIRTGGADETTVHFLDLNTRQPLAVTLPPARQSVQIAPGGSLVYYSTLDDKGPRVWRRLLTDPAAKPELLFGEGLGGAYSADIWLSEDGRFLEVTVAEGWTRSWVRLLDTTTHQWMEFSRDLDAITSGKVAGRTLFLLTSWNAPNKRIYRVDLDRPQQMFWKLIVPEAPDNLEGFVLAGGGLVLQYTHVATSRLRRVSALGQDLGDIPFPSLGSVGLAGDDWSGVQVDFRYTSFTVPNTIYRYDLATRKLAEWAHDPVPFDAHRVEVRQIWYKSKDGTDVPMFVIAPRDATLDGKRPTLLTGYGGFAISRTPGFDAMNAYWLEQGGVVALPNLRGGAEFGEAWHHAGMRANKQNVFDDFTAAAEWLIRNKYTSPAKLAIAGGSNGGLLVGVALTQRPDLFRAVLCAVPLLDMLRYHKFLLGPLWVPEYGSAADPAQFEYLLRYSPYQHVRPGTRYPAVLLKTGDADTRVAPLHARKMTALLQAATASGLPVALHYDTSVGHSAGLPITKTIDDTTDILSFFKSQLGL